MVLGGVVGDKGGGGEGRDRWGDEVGLGGVEVAAARVDSKRPGGEPGGLPSGQGEGVVEELGDGGVGEGGGGEGS